MNDRYILLPWQQALIGFVIAIQASLWAIPTYLALGIFLLYSWCQKIEKKIYLHICFGIFLAFLISFNITHTKSQLKNAGNYTLSATIKSVTPNPENKQSIILGDILFSSNKNIKHNFGNEKIVWKWTNASFNFRRGDRVYGNFSLKKIISTKNFGVPDYSRWMHSQNIFYQSSWYGNKSSSPIILSRSSLTPLYNFIYNKVKYWNGKSEGKALILGLLFGDRTNLSKNFINLAQDLSISHILALSGLHMSIVIFLGFCISYFIIFINPKILFLISRPKLNIYCSTPLVLLYLWLGSFSSSLLRASLMFMVCSFCILLEKKRPIIDGIFISLLIFAIFSPSSLLDMKLQLSFLATFGVIAFYYIFSKILTKPKNKLLKIFYWLFFILGSSIAANIFCLPIILTYFGKISPHFWVNVIWLPALSLFIMPLAFLGLILSCLPYLNFIGNFLGFCAVNSLDILIQFSKYIHTLGLKSVATIRPIFFTTIGYFACLTAFCSWFAIKQKTKRHFFFIAVCLILILIPLSMRVLNKFGDYVSITILDVGHGLSVIIEHNGERALIDSGGIWPFQGDIGKFTVLPAYTYNYPPNLRYAILSHPDRDHSDGFYYLSNYLKIADFYSTNGWDKKETNLVKILQSNKIPFQILKTGDKLKLAKDLILEVIHPNKPYKNNDNSIVIRVVWKNKGLCLIPGDIEKKAISAILAQEKNIDSTILILPHHGSKTSLSIPFYKKINPLYAVASSNNRELNTFPHPSVVQALENCGIKIMSTAKLGAIKFIWNKPNEFKINFAK